MLPVGSQNQKTSPSSDATAARPSSSLGNRRRAGLESSFADLARPSEAAEKRGEPAPRPAQGRAENALGVPGGARAAPAERACGSGDEAAAAGTDEAEDEAALASDLLVARRRL